MIFFLVWQGTARPWGLGFSPRPRSTKRQVGLLSPQGTSPTSRRNSQGSWKRTECFRGNAYFFLFFFVFFCFLLFFFFVFLCHVSLFYSVFFCVVQVPPKLMAPSILGNFRPPGKERARQQGRCSQARPQPTRAAGKARTPCKRCKYFFFDFKHFYR